ncbi:sensor histidine kinase [Sporanaerobacter acetigenes]|uniref:histidine kinase n=1 Tax=Sporanaerobacter acetigenes DSM 13106 TaxID=1123281 RepID=A0A1M5YVF1_9FIRM|nr:histidine kinase [Sporanaerobacter acetigenes]SHI16066.1 Signal transduction histidine kinase [Sporanaerobacter acetigenes DSM 13106]
MRNFVEKLFIMLLCLYNTYKIEPDANLVVYFLISLIVSLALDLLDDKRIKSIIYLLFVILCFSHNLFVFYLPLILYNMCLDFKIYTLFTLPLVLMNSSIINLLSSIGAVYLSIMTKKYNIILDENKVVRDDLKEDTFYLKKYNEQLKIDKEKNIHIAILTERNRIAREIHDSIGHTISSSILQVEALKVISTEDHVVKNLDTLQETLQNGMNDIRKSIHNLYNESLDLKNQVEKLCSKIPAIDIELVYRIEDELGYDLKFDILSVVKEAMTNCSKHSNATKLKISLISQPKFYSILIEDNGSQFDEKNKGMGLLSMNEIAHKYNGYFNYRFDQGFKIHMTLMKG